MELPVPSRGRQCHCPFGPGPERTPSTTCSVTEMSNQSADLTVHRLKIDLSSDPVEVCPWFDRVTVDLHNSHATGEPPALPETSAVHLREFVARLPVADLAEFRIVEFFVAVRTPSRILRRRATVWAVVFASQPHHADAAMHLCHQSRLVGYRKGGPPNGHSQPPRGGRSASCYSDHRLYCPNQNSLASSFSLGTPEAQS